VVVLSKLDLAHDLAADLAAVARVTGSVPVVPLSGITGEGVDLLEPYLEPGRTLCLLGSSGVGKSTLLNALLGEERQRVRAVREDDSRGRHTTTSRELIALPGGALLIDTPGLRSVGLWDDGSGLEQAFADIEGLAGDCRFRDCRHGGEPGCAVRAAIASGDLDESRLASHRKLERELRSIDLRADVAASRAEGRRLGRLYREAGRASRRRSEGW
jgi:ribosome biogenesis GTPase